MNQSALFFESFAGSGISWVIRWSAYSLIVPTNMSPSAFMTCCAATAVGARRPTGHATRSRHARKETRGRSGALRVRLGVLLGPGPDAAVDDEVAQQEEADEQARRDAEADEHGRREVAPRDQEGAGQEDEEADEGEREDEVGGFAGELARPWEHGMLWLLLLSSSASCAGVVAVYGLERGATE